MLFTYLQICIYVYIYCCVFKHGVSKCIYSPVGAGEEVPCQRAAAGPADSGGGGRQVSDGGSPAL